MQFQALQYALQWQMVNNQPEAMMFTHYLSNVQVDTTQIRQRVLNAQNALQKSYATFLQQRVLVLQVPYAQPK